MRRAEQSALAESTRDEHYSRATSIQSRDSVRPMCGGNAMLLGLRTSDLLFPDALYQHFLAFGGLPMSQGG